MIEALKNDDLVNKVGGQFRLTALIQKRAVELMQGARPLVEPKGRTLIEVAVDEIDQGKIVVGDPAAAKDEPDGLGDE